MDKDKLGIKEYLTIGIALLGVAGTFAVSNYRIGLIETRVTKYEDDPVRLTLLERDVKALRCDIGNLKRVLKQQPERDCNE